MLAAFACAGFLAGFDGALWASRYATIDARVASGFELTVIAAVVVGGVGIRGGSGTVLGIALGGLTLLVIRNGLTLVRVDPLWLQGVYGLVILGAITIDAIVARRSVGRMPSTGTGHWKTMIKNFFGRFASWTGFLAVLFASVLFYATISVPHFASAFNLSQAAAGVSEKAILLLPMALLIIAREIDLSVASILAFTSVVLGVLMRAHVPLVAAIPLVLLAGAAAGASTVSLSPV